MDKSPRILIVTPEISFLPQGMGNMAERTHAKAGGLADICAGLTQDLFERGVDVHVAVPNYRRLFEVPVFRLHPTELRLYHRKNDQDRIHFAEDRCFYYRDRIYNCSDRNDDPHAALVFQREVINQILPHVQPDLVHCHDWMTGLIPAVTTRMGILSLFTVHNVYTVHETLDAIEAVGIDAAEFWSGLYYDRLPDCYEESRSNNPVDFLTSGILAANHVTTGSQAFLDEVVWGHHAFIPSAIRQEISNKYRADAASGILNTPDATYDPETDRCLTLNYTSRTHVEAKISNKVRFQEALGLEARPELPLFLWPSRLDPVPTGLQLLASILPQLMKEAPLQIAVVADGQDEEAFRYLIRIHSLENCVALSPFRESVLRLGYAASDFVLTPSSFEPCGLAQIIGLRYGALPVAYHTGSLRETVSHLNAHRNEGNGFVFEVWDPNGLRWAIDQAMMFYQQPLHARSAQITRIMTEAQEQFHHSATSREYRELYERLLSQPVGTPEPASSRS